MAAELSVHSKILRTLQVTTVELVINYDYGIVQHRLDRHLKSLSVSSQQCQAAPAPLCPVLSQQEGQFSSVAYTVAAIRQLGVAFQPLSGDQRCRGNISRGGTTDCMPPE